MTRTGCGLHVQLPDQSLRGRATAHWTLQEVDGPTSLLLEDCRKSHKKARCERLKRKEPFPGNKEVEFQSIKTQSLGTEAGGTRWLLYCAVWLFPRRKGNARPFCRLLGTLWVLCVWLCALSVQFLCNVMGLSLTGVHTVDLLATLFNRTLDSLRNKWGLCKLCTVACPWRSRASYHYCYYTKLPFVYICTHYCVYYPPCSRHRQGT